MGLDESYSVRTCSHFGKCMGAPALKSPMCNSAQVFCEKLQNVKESHKFSANKTEKRK